MMNVSVKRQLLKALRSGEYVQGFGYLRVDNDITKYCIMGVLCKLHQKEHRLSHGNWQGSEQYLGAHYYLHINTLHENVAKWAGFTGTNPHLKLDTGEVRSLMYINDSLKLPFTEIANLIEEQL